MIEQRNFWSLGRIFRTMPERFLRIPRRALHFAIRNILLFYKRVEPFKKVAQFAKTFRKHEICLSFLGD